MQRERESCIERNAEEECRERVAERDAERVWHREARTEASSHSLCLLSGKGA